MDKKTINEIISDWKTHSLPDKGYPSHGDRFLYLNQLFEEIRKYGFSRSEASSQSVANKILERLIAKTAKNDIKKSLNQTISDQIERAISMVYGSFSSVSVESVEKNIQRNENVPLTLGEKKDIDKETPNIMPPQREKTVKYLSEDKRKELMRQFKFRTGCDEDLE